MIFSFVISLFVLSLLVFVHELGHFLACRKTGVKVEEFGLGYPPRIKGISRGETIYSVNLIPFGGFVRIDEKALSAKPKRVRLAVLLAGILMNFLLGVFAFTLIYSFLGIPKKQGFVEIVAVVEGSAAEKGGMAAQDVIKNFKTNQEFLRFVNANLGQEIELELVRQGLPLSVVVVPRKEPPEGEGALGVVISDSKMVQPVFWQRPFFALWWGTKEAVGWAKAVVFGVSGIIRDLIFRGVVPKDITGPVGIVRITSDVVKRGMVPLLHFVAMLSVYLSVFNLLPIPALDGGRLLFLGVEAITGKKPKPKWENRIHMIGMILLLLLMLTVTMQDIKRILPTPLWPF